MAQTHNRQVDAVRAATLAALNNRPVIDPHDHQLATTITGNAVDWLREAYRLLASRPDLTQYLQTAAANLKVLQTRLEQEKPQ